MSTTNLIDLDVITEQRSVRLFGGVYQIKHPLQLDVVAYKWVFTKTTRMQELDQKEELTEAERTEYDALLDRFLREVLVAPADVRAKLEPIQKLMVLAVFSTLLPETPQAEGATTRTAEATTRPSTGSTSSPGSSGSTQGRRRKPGSRARR